MKIYIIALLLLLACSNKESRTIVHTSEKIDLSINQDESSSSKKIILNWGGFVHQYILQFFVRQNHTIQFV